MALRATFIGISKHVDPGIRDLTGARRDATALWALFCDTMPQMETESTLLVDEQATVDAIRTSLDETLGTASADDTVIVSFSGHGSHDHRLVASDTDLADLASTSIPMSELAERFKASDAKAVFFILDCCFSGGAPARVLEDSPIPRNPAIPLRSLAGEGRILIAASKEDEASYELPGTGHGLLTKALLTALQSDQNVVDLTAAMTQVMESVRAEAARIGVDQTPVMLGYIQGGLTLPGLRAGQRYFDAFPEARGVRVGASVADLAAFNLPDQVLTAWSAAFPKGLNELQLAAVNDHRVLDGASLLVVAPTSSGKTFIGEMAATRAIADGRKAVFLLPYRALVNEKYDQFSLLYGETLGMRVIRCTGDYVDQAGPFVRGKYDLAVLTYEMFLNLAVSNQGVLNQLGLVVLDEAQFITDPNRGLSVELLLTYLLTARERGIAPQLVVLSAVIGDVNDFDAWLGCSKLVTDKRPIPLIEGVLDRSGIYQYVDEMGAPQTTQLLPAHAIRMRRDKPSAQDVIVPLVRQLVSSGEKVIVFRNQRGSAQGCAKYLADDIGLPAATDALSRLPSYDLSSSSSALRACLGGGTAFHTANLAREERIVVEQAFRDPTGPVRVLAATTTVAAGINTPASTVILAEQVFIGDDGRPFTVAEYKNMAGRAGRLGFNEVGRSVILADNAHARVDLFRRYVLALPEAIRSSFDPQQLDTWVIRLLAQVDQVPRDDVIRLLANTYGGYVKLRENPKWRLDMEEQLTELLDRMLSLELLEDEDDRLQLTLLGRACGRSALSLSSAMRLINLLRKVNVTTLRAEELMALLQVLPEADGGYTPMFKRGRPEAKRPGEAVQRYSPDIVRALQTVARDELDYWARCKRAAILWDWVQGTPIGDIESLYTTTPFQGAIGAGDIRRFADATRFHLRSAHQILTVLYVGQGPSEEAIEALLNQLEVGIPADALDLLTLPMPLSRGEYLALRETGVTSTEALWKQPSERLAEILGLDRSSQLERLRPLSA